MQSNLDNRFIYLFFEVMTLRKPRSLNYETISKDESDILKVYFQGLFFLGYSHKKNPYCLVSLVDSSCRDYQGQVEIRHGPAEGYQQSERSYSHQHTLSI